MLLVRAALALEHAACSVGALRCATWQARPSDRLYAGRLHPGLAQYATHVGLALGRADRRNIAHDVRTPMPIEDGAIAAYQAEDVFEHIAYDEIPPIFADIHRVLKPGGLFRFSVPDYRCDVLHDRALRNAAGAIVFDPMGGGRLERGRVVDGGHLWFPVIETVRALFDASSFARCVYLHYMDENGVAVLNPIDYGLGNVQRTPDHDSRVREPRRALSIVVDAWK